MESGPGIACVTRTLATMGTLCAPTWVGQKRARTVQIHHYAMRELVRRCLTFIFEVKIVWAMAFTFVLLLLCLLNRW